MPNHLEYTAVIPVYNASRTLSNVIQSVQSLPLAPTEIIVVDDLSSDGSAEIAQNTGENIKVIQLGGRRGAPIARNTGAKSANTPFLLLLDSDCYVSHDGFMSAVNFLACDNSIAGVMGVFSPTAPDGPFAGHFKNFFRHHEITEMRNPPPVFNSSCFLISKEAYMSVGGFDEYFGRLPTEDNEFYFRLTTQGHKIPYLSDFSFVHDKPLNLKRLLHEDMERAAGIILNMRGKLGHKGDSAWSIHEKIRWAAEIFFGNLAVALLALSPIAILHPQWGAIMGMLLVSSIFSVYFINRKKLKSASANFGILFSIKVLAYRILEMVAASVGIVLGAFAKGLPERPHSPKK